MTNLSVSGPIDATSVVCRSSNHFKTDHDGSTVIMSVEAGKFFTFDAIGFEIWEAIAKFRPVSDVVAELAKKHNAPAEQVERDVLKFLDRLAAEELLDTE